MASNISSAFKSKATVSPNLVVTASSTPIPLIGAATHTMSPYEEYSLTNAHMTMTSTQAPDLPFVYSPNPNNSYDDYAITNFNDQNSGGPVLERQNMETHEGAGSNLQSSTMLQPSPSSNTFTQVDPQHASSSHQSNENRTITMTTSPVPGIDVSTASNHSLDQSQPTGPQITASQSANQPDEMKLNSTEASDRSDQNLATNLERKPMVTSPEGRSISSLSSPASTNLTTPISTSSNDNTNLPRIQILKPKVKFNCTQPSDCKNGSVCFNGRCFCMPGFTGESCDINIDECRQFDGDQPCLNNGTCVDEINSFRCDCAPGYRGERCHELADMCSDLPCLNNATCVNHRTSYTCQCESGWEGKHCETNIDDCAKNPCQNGATCHDLIGNYRCECASGFSGTNCETNIDDCANYPCQNNATCKDLDNDYQCECSPGFRGKNCEENIDDCLSSPCVHGKCTDLIHGFRCTCHDGWMGELCDNDINECESGRPVCLNGGSCENLEPSYQCHCREGWTGKYNDSSN